MFFLVAFTAIVLVLLTVALVAPVTLTFKVGIRNERTPANVEGRITIQWLFGLAQFRSEYPGKRYPLRTNGRSHPSRRQTTKRTAKRRGTALFVIFRDPEFRRRIYRFFKSLARAAEVRDLRLHVRLGLGDPADTGCLWALMGPVHAFASNVDEADIAIEPDFLETVFQFRSSGTIRFVPLQFLWLALAFTVSPTTVRAWRTMAGARA